MTEVRHDVARHAARTAAYEQNAKSQCRLKPEDVYQQIGHAWHDEELGARSYQDIQWPAGQNAEVVGGQCQSHGQHDDAEDDGLRGSSHPFEQFRCKEGYHGNGYNEERGVF